MFDRFKKSADGAPKSDATGTPPAASGFGRRQIPVAGSAPTDLPPPAATPGGGFGRRVTKPAETPAETPAELQGGAIPMLLPGQLNPNPDLKKAGKGGTAIVNLLMQAYRDGRGVHVETILGAIAVLAGEFALRAAVAVLPKQGWIAGGPADALMFGGFPGEKNRPTMWSVVQVVAMTELGGMSQLPNMDVIATRASKAIAANSFPPPLSIPSEHFPREFSPNACPRFRGRIMAIAAEHDLDPTETALAFGFAIGILIKNTHQLVPAKVLTTLAAELMVAMTRVAPRDEEVR